MNPKLEETIYKDFITSSSTGAAADADSLPTAEVFEDATDTPIVTPTVTKRTGRTGNYRVSIACLAASGFEAGKSYNVVVSATVGGQAAKAVLLSFQVRAASVDDALQPTTAGRKLDVSAGGEAGIDWANVGSPATALNLSGTTVKTATDVEADTQDLQGRLPAALNGGRMDASVGAMAAGVVTAAAIATNAIDADALAPDAVTEIQSGLATGTNLGTALSNLATLLGFVDVTLSSRLPTSGYTAPDNAGITTAAAQATAANTQATAANTKAGAIQTVLAGITSLAHWLRAGFRKSAPDATAATEIGGTYDATTDSQEALRDQGDAAWTTGGGGGSSPTVEEIAAEVDSVLSQAHGAGEWGAASGVTIYGRGGPGPYTITVKGAGGQRLKDAYVYVSKDLAGAECSDTLPTDALGEVTFDLYEPPAYAWIDHPLYLEANPYALPAP